MAEFTSPEEFEKYLSAMKEQYEAGYLSAQDYNAALKDAAAGVKGYTANLKNSMAQLGTSFKQLGKAIYDGKQGAATYNEAMSSGADLVAAYALKFGPAGVALGLFTKAVVGYVNAANKQSDALYESYQKISRSGAIGSDAMDQVFESAVKMGYTVDQLGNLGSILAENSKNFGLFSSSAITGAKQFTEASKGLQDTSTRKYFFNLGLTVDDINNGLAGFYKQEGALVQLRGRSTADLIQGSKAYIREMEILTRLTGQTREEMEAQREDALNVDAFYASLMDMPAEAQKEALATYNRLAAINQKAAAEFAANFSGAITGSTDLLVSTQGQSLRLTKEAYKAGMKSSDAMQILSDSARPMIEVTKQVAQVGGQIGLSARTMNQLGNKGLDPLQKQFDDIAKDVDKAGDGFNSATNSQSTMRDAQIKSAQNLQEFVKLGVAPATKAMQFLAEAVENLTSFIPGAGRTRKGVTSGKPTTKSGGGVEGVSVTGEVDLSGGGGGGGEEKTAPIAKTDVDKILATIRKRESGGNYAIQAKGSSASGAYQFIDKTWQALTKQANVGTEFKTAKEAPKEIQDAIAKLHVENLLKQAGGDVSKVPLGWYTGNVQGKISPEAMAANNGLTPEEYQRKWMMDYNKMAGPNESAANGAILSGPTSGYRPNLTMHGTEAVVPLNTPAQQAAAGMDSGIMVAQLDKLDELISIMKNQLGVSTRIMQSSI
jgi:hypothetical protein